MAARKDGRKAGRRTSHRRYSTFVFVKCLGPASYLRLIDSCLTQLKAQGPSRTCNESNEEEGEVAQCLGPGGTPSAVGPLFGHGAARMGDGARVWGGSRWPSQVAAPRFTMLMILTLGPCETSAQGWSGAGRRVTRGCKKGLGSALTWLLRSTAPAHCTTRREGEPVGA